MSFDFEEIEEEYLKVGLDLSKLSCGCSIKIDLKDVVYPGLNSIEDKLRELGVLINTRADADVFPHYEEMEIHRRVYNLNTPEADPEDVKNLNPDRAIILLSLYRENVTSELFAKKMLDVIKRITSSGAKFVIGKGHSIKGAKTKEEEIILFDFISVKKRTQKQIGYTAVNNDTIQIIDRTQSPSASVHVEVALSNALNDLFVFGIKDDIRFYPVYNAPDEKLLEEIEKNIRSYLRKYKFDAYDMKSIGNKNFLLGATVTGYTDKEPPMFYDKLEEGDKILVHRPFGDLAPITGYYRKIMDIGFLKKFNEKELKIAKEEILSLISKPNLKVAEIINKYCPEYGEKFSRDEHIIATSDISGPGIYIFKELAKKTHRDLYLENIPLLYEELTITLVQNNLLVDGTAGTNGAIIMMASEPVIENIYYDLHKAGFDPRIIGNVGKNGEGDVFVPKVAKKFISLQSLLEEFEFY